MRALDALFARHGEDDGRHLRDASTAPRKVSREPQALGRIRGLIAVRAAAAPPAATAAPASALAAPSALAAATAAPPLASPAAAPTFKGRPCGRLLIHPIHLVGGGSGGGGAILLGRRRDGLAQLRILGHVEHPSALSVCAEEFHKGATTALEPAQMERHVPIKSPDELSVAPTRRADPLQELFRLAQRGREGDELGRRVHVHQCLFPHRAALRVVDVVDLVRDDAPEVLKVIIAHRRGRALAQEPNGCNGRIGNHCRRPRHLDELIPQNLTRADDELGHGAGRRSNLYVARK